MASQLIRCWGPLATMLLSDRSHSRGHLMALAVWDGNGRYLTEMEKSPGELWLARMMKKPTSLPISKFSAWCRERPSWNHLLDERKPENLGEIPE